MMVCAAKAFRIGTGVKFLIAGFLTLFLASCQSPQSKEQPAVSHAQAQATTAFWNRLYDLNVQLNQQLDEIIKSLEKESQDGSTFVELLPKFANQFSNLYDAYTRSLKQMPLLDVDERLVKETADDLRTGAAGVNHLNGMADALVAYAEWCKRKQNPENSKVIGDMIYSFVNGLVGRPLAGLDKMEKEEAGLDAEGQQILGVYLQQLQGWNLTIEQIKVDDVKELELRAYLAKKYSAEFKPMPQSDSNGTSK